MTSRRPKTDFIGHHPKKLTEIITKRNEDGTRAWALHKEHKNDYFLGFIKSTYINRGLFRAWLIEYNRMLERTDQKRCVVLDNLAGHFMRLDEKKQFKKYHPDSLCFVDSTSFDRITLLYLPPCTTATSQPSDLGYYCAVQGGYRRWFNLQPSKKTISRETKINQVKIQLEAENNLDFR